LAKSSICEKKIGGNLYEVFEVNVMKTLEDKKGTLYE
jgi:hypothetical protein